MKPAIHTKINLSLGLLLGLGNLSFLLILPLITHQLLWLLTGAILNGLLTHPNWSLIHEAIHRVYHPQQKINGLCGRLLSILFGTVFAPTQYGHLMHHGMNRQGPDLIDAYDPHTTSFWLASLRYYLHIFGGLYLFQVFGPLLVFLPRNLLQKLMIKNFGVDSPYYQVARQKLLPSKILRQMRVDAFCLYTLLAISAWLYASHVWILIVGFLWRGLMISFSDNLPHYGTPVDQNRYAYNTYLPTVLRLFWLNFNLHRIHHEEPRLPWHLLHERFMETRDHYNIAYFRQALKQLKGVWPK